MVLGVSMDAPRALQCPPGLLWGAFVGALGVSPGAFWMLFLVQEGIGSKSDEMHENDDPLNGIAVFLASRALQNVAKMVPDDR